MLEEAGELFGDQA